MWRGVFFPGDHTVPDVINKQGLTMSDQESAPATLCKERSLVLGGPQKRLILEGH